MRLFVMNSPGLGHLQSDCAGRQIEGADVLLPQALDTERHSKLYQHEAFKLSHCPLVGDDEMAASVSG